MSTLKIINLQHPSNANNNVVLDANGNMTCTGTVVGGSSLGMRNRIINGDMGIDQRNAGASVSITTANPYTLDRWNAICSVSSKYTVQQNAGSVTPPAGFVNYLGCVSSAATSVGGGDYYLIRQSIEGLNVADLGWGSAGAQTVTLSFKVYSSLTGTFGGCIGNSNNTRAYPFTYTISSANTWTSINVTIPGDTTGTWLTTNGIGFKITFSLGMGSTYSATAGSWASGEYYSATGAVSVVGTNGATFYLTGVQLEVGSVATPFERRPYGLELSLCQRYYEFGGAYAQAATSAGGVVGSTIQYKITKRASPTVALTAINGSSASKVTNFSASGLVNGIGYYCIPNGNGQATVDWTASIEL